MRSGFWLISTKLSSGCIYKEQETLPGYFEPRRCMSVTYLGVVLDSRPSLREHVDVTVRKAYNLFWACDVKWG